jgi:RNase P subunit RPR2
MSTVLTTELRCQGITTNGGPCRVKLAEFLDGKMVITCRRCGHVNIFKAVTEITALRAIPEMTTATHK